LHLLPDNFFLAIWRLTQKKWWHALLPSFAKLVRYDSTQHLVILGEGELFSEMEEYIKKHSLSSNIHLLWIQKNTAFFYEHATTFVLPSLAETLGLVFLEALSFGVPIIAADIPALRLIHQVDEKENLQFPHKTEYGYLVSWNNSSVFLSPEEISEDESLYLALVEWIKVSFSPDVLRSRAEQFDIKRTIFLWKKLIKSYE
jgi:glycosyltransferase involved in cell wall biosynthesis